MALSYHLRLTSPNALLCQLRLPWVEASTYRIIMEAILSSSVNDFEAHRQRFIFYGSEHDNAKGHENIGS